MIVELLFNTIIGCAKGISIVNAYVIIKCTHIEEHTSIG